MNIKFIFTLAGILTLGGAIAKIAGFKYAPYIFAVGTALFIYCHVKNIMAKSDDEFRTRRLARLGFISVLMLLIACGFMFIGSNIWVVFLLIYALITFFLSFRSD